MPANLAAAAPTGVLPQTLSTAFTESRGYPILNVSYHDGTQEQSIIQDGVNAPRSLKVWSLSKRLQQSDFDALRSFYEAHQGGLQSFYFYNPFEAPAGTQIGSNYDPTGASVEGRHTVFFRGDWTEQTDMGRSITSIQLIEVA